MVDAIQTLIAELRDYKQSENAQRIRATVETMVAAFQQVDTAIGSIPAGSIAAPFSTGIWAMVDQSGAGLAFVTSQADYTVIGNMCFARGICQYPATASALAAKIGNLPFPAINGPGSVAPSLANPSGFYVVPSAPTNTLSVFTVPGNAPATNANLSGAFLSFQLIYQIS